jgi:hypothetical protein
MSASCCVWILLAGLSYPLLAQQDSAPAIPTTEPATPTTQPAPQASPVPQLQRHGSDKEANPNRQITAPNPQLTLDVVVTDGAGNPVSGLQSQDFTVLDNKKTSRLVSFQAETASTARADSAVEIMLVVDAINASYANVTLAEDQINITILW